MTPWKERRAPCGLQRPDDQREEFEPERLTPSSGTD